MDIPTLSVDERHVLWLDYDDVISAPILRDIWAAASHLSVGSVLLVTVDVDPPKNTESLEDWKRYYEDVAYDYVGNDPLTEYSRSLLARINRLIVARAISSGVSGRGADVMAIPVFSFSYADGHEVITMGCVLGGEHEKNLVSQSPLRRQVYYRDSF